MKELWVGAVVLHFYQQEGEKKKSLMDDRASWEPEGEEIYPYLCIATHTDLSPRAQMMKKGNTRCNPGRTLDLKTVD